MSEFFDIWCNIMFVYKADIGSSLEKVCFSLVFENLELFIFLIGQNYFIFQCSFLFNFFFFLNGGYMWGLPDFW